MFTKLDLIERIISTDDEKVLERVRRALATDKDEFAFTQEHLALLEERRNRRKQGKGKAYSINELKAMLKSPRK